MPSQICKAAIMALMNAGKQVPHVNMVEVENKKKSSHYKGLEDNYIRYNHFHGR